MHCRCAKVQLLAKQGRVQKCTALVPTVQLMEKQGKVPKCNALVPKYSYWQNKNHRTVKSEFLNVLTKVKFFCFIKLVRPSQPEVVTSVSWVCFLP